MAVALAEFGGIDILVNNAGILNIGTVEDFPLSEWQRILDINLTGVFLGIRAVTPAMKAAGRGSIINISSIEGMAGTVACHGYTATKFAVRGFTEALRHETADSDLHVMCVHPGGIKTGIAHSARFYVGPDGGNDQGKAAGDFVNKMARTTPDQAASKILSDLGKRKGRCLIGVDAQVISAISRLVPVNYWRVMGRLLPS